MKPFSLPNSNATRAYLSILANKKRKKAAKE